MKYKQLEVLLRKKGCTMTLSTVASSLGENTSSSVIPSGKAF